MPVQPDNYDHRGKGNYGIVLCCPVIVAPGRLVYFDYNRQSGHWVIRDFISDRLLDNFHSALTLAEIEADATHGEFPPWRNVIRQAADWKIYLQMRTAAYFREGPPAVAMTAPNPLSGTWAAIT